MSRNRNWMLALALVGANLLVHGQKTDASGGVPAPTLRITARSVVIDAVVTDRIGRVVPGLTRDDFQVSENGVPQKIDFFESHTDEVTDNLRPSEPLPPNTFTNATSLATGAAVNVLLIDSLNTNTADRIGVRRQLIDLVRTLPLRVPVAVLELGDKLRIVQGFTVDPNEAIASVERYLNGANQPLTQALPGGGKAAASALDSLNSAGASPGASQTAEAVGALQDFMAHAYDVQQNQQVLTTLQALLEISRYVSPIPARKNLLWVSGSFPLCIPGMTYSSQADCPYNDLFEKTVNMLGTARISLYPVDASIVGVPNADIGGKTEQPDMSSGTVNLGKEQFRRITTEAMAQATGGEAFHSNDLRKEMSSAIDRGSRYYTLAYTPMSAKTKNGTHKIEVRLASSQYKVFYRRQYFDDNAAARTASTPPESPLPSLMTHGMPAYSQVRYRLNVEPATREPADTQDAGDGTALQAPVKLYRVRFFVAPETVDLQTGTDGVQRAQVEVRLIARDEAGKALNWMTRAIGLAVRPEQLAQTSQSGISFHLDIDVPKDGAYLASGVFDPSANRAGTLQIPLKAIREAAVAANASRSTKQQEVQNLKQQRIRTDKLATKAVTVAQLEQLIPQLAGKSEKDAAAQVAECRLTERLATDRMEKLLVLLQAEHVRAALTAVADASAFLPLPQSDLTADAAPDVEAQRAILSKAIEFVVANSKQMPDFIAERRTTQFGDTKFGIQANDPVITTPEVFHEISSETATVRYRNGREEQADQSIKAKTAGLGAPDMGLRTWGVFGPMLQTVMRDILLGKIGWGRWEVSPSGRLAVFRYDVPKKQATYTLRWCCVHIGPGIFHEIEAVPQYHGEIAVDPASGAVMRMVLMADLERGQQVSSANAFVEYDRIEIGGRPYICPKRSATVLVANSPIERGQHSLGGQAMYHETEENVRVMSISDSAFYNYHVFRSEMHIVER